MYLCIVIGNNSIHVYNPVYRGKKQIACYQSIHLKGLFPPKRCNVWHQKWWFPIDSSTDFIILILVGSGIVGIRIGIILSDPSVVVHLDRIVRSEHQFTAPIVLEHADTSSCLDRAESLRHCNGRVKHQSIIYLSVPLSIQCNNVNAKF